MAKKRSPQQSSLYAKPIPTMPEGYYSSGPNPNLSRFIEEHATPYDPATDEYNVPPFDQPISTTKATAIYNMHTYWSKKPHDAIRQYIRHYTKPGDLVLDPFCGSGGTALAALMEGRKAIAIDLSPAATFITKNYCTPVDVNELQRAFAELERKVKPEMEWLYETRCDRCDGRAQTAYTVYSQVFRCERCLQEVPLFDCIEIEGQTAAGKPKKITICPYCHRRGVEEEISTRDNEKLGAIPVLVSYECQDGCKPKRDQRRHNDPDPKKQSFFQKHDLGKLAEIDAKTIPYWTPPHRMMNVESDTEPWGDKWRAGTSNFRTVAELFTKRNLWALAVMLHTVRQLENETMLFAFQSNTLSASIMQQYREDGGGFAKGTYYVPQIFIEREQLGCLERKVEDVRKGIQTFSDLILSTNLLISTQSATMFTEIPTATVDYIFTDPPYTGKIQFGELNFVWEAWLNFGTSWHYDEMIINRTRGISEQDWAQKLRNTMSEAFRVLKPNRWLSLCYHDDEGIWQIVQDIMAEVGFVTEEADHVLFIEATQKSYNQNKADYVNKRDLVINFRKPCPGEITQLTLQGNEDQATFIEKAQAILTEALQSHPGATADRLYDILVSRMVRRGEFERHNFEALLNGVAEPVKESVMANLFEKKQPELFGGHEIVRWYLRATADEVDEAESAKESAAAQRLERYMTGYMINRPEESGVHYSDLFEQYLPVGDKPRRLLQEWLPEFFFKTTEGTWRPPLSDEEREQKATLRTSGALRRIKRFARALLESVPPAPHDHPANAATAADWIRQCRRAGMYELGRAIYEKGGFAFGVLSEEAQLEVEEDYQVCVRRM